MERVTSTSLQETLDRLGPPIAAGSVNVISVAAVRERSGNAWARKAEHVDAFLRRTFSRHGGAGDMLIALNEVEYLTVLPEVSRSVALNLSATLLGELLTFFLGSAAREDIRLFQVRAFAEGRLMVEPIDALAAQPAAHAPAGAGPETTPPNLAGTATPVDHASAVNGARRYSVSSETEFAVEVDAEPVWNITAGAVTSLRLITRVSPVAGLAGGRAEDGWPSAPALEGEVGLATLRHAVATLTDESVVVRTGLHVPLPLTSLTASTSRQRLLDALRAMDTDLRRLLILEITGIDGGIPQSRLSELVALLNPYSRGVLARAPSETADLRSWRHCRLSGVSLDCRAIDPSDRSAHLRLGAFAASVSEVAPACLGYALSSRSLMLAAWAAGFTHVSGPFVSRAVACVGSAVRLKPADLYTAPASPLQAA